MHIPRLYEKFAENYPEIIKNFKELGKICRDSGPLPPKYQDLINLGIAVGAGSRGAVMSHTRKALAAGATAEEITHAVLLSLTTTGFPNMMAALSWADEVLSKEAS